MIRLQYSIKLARTKLRSKPGILATSIVVASLLFAALIACIIVFTGAEKSAVNYIKKANNDQYLALVNPVIPHDEIRFSNDLSIEEVREIKAFEKQYYDNLRAKYAELDLTYDEAEVPPLIPAAWKPTNLPEELRVSINWNSPVMDALLKEKYEAYAKTATNKFDDLKAIGEKYSAGGYYIQRPSGFPSLPNSTLIQDGQETFGDTEMKAHDLSTYGYFTNSIHNSQYDFVDKALVDRYLTTTSTSDLEGIPVVVSAQEAAALFGKQYDIGVEPEDESKKAMWLKQIQTDLNGQTYQVCYRNSTERAMLDKIQRDYAEMQSNEGSKDYTKPNLIYDYPSTPCGNIITEEDTRTDTEKEAAAHIENVQKQLGTYVPPEHRKLTFQIVGFINAQPFTEYTSDIESYVKNLIAANDTSTSAFIPLQMYDSLPDTMRFGGITAASPTGITEEFATRVVEFNSINDARTFMENETCPSSDTNCKKKFTAHPYGSNYLILDEISQLFIKIISIALPILLGLATIIIWFTISRIMTENRKETAIYRAMGAKRHDIIGIYFTYILLIALFVAIVSLALGLALAYVVDYTYGSQLTDIATASFGTITDNLQFELFDLSSPYVWGIIGVIFIVCILASVQPIIRNILRPPIQDIRDE